MGNNPRPWGFGLKEFLEILGGFVDAPKNCQKKTDGFLEDW